MISPRDKTSHQALLFLERIFLFLDLDCQNLATLDFDNRPISEKENSLAEKKLCLRAFLSQYNTFPANRKIYVVCALMEDAVSGIATNVITNHKEKLIEWN